MKNNKLPLKERYNNFIQKYPKFWLTLIYGVLMLALAITMLIAVINPPNSKTASAMFKSSQTCPSTEYNKDFYFSTNLNTISPSDCFDIASNLSPSSDFDYFTVGASLLITSSSNNLIPLSFRYLVVYKYHAITDTGEIFRANIYFSNSIQDPRVDGFPSDRVSCLVYDDDNATYSFSDLKYAFINGAYLQPYDHLSLDRIVDFVRLSDLICENGCWVPDFGSCSPDDLKAEYDKGHSDGLIEGEQVGYDKGFIAGQNSVDPFPNPVSYLIEPVVSFLNVKFFDTLTLGGVLSVGIFVMVAVMFIKLFAGG